MKVILVCSAGMSSAIAAKSLREAATKEGIAMEVHEASSQMFEEMVAKGNYQLALVAPQIRHRFDTLKPIADQAGMPILQIAPKGYTGIGGKYLLQQIKDEAGQVLDLT
ncbi:PTS sugar transporter subunit IIB [Facklamia sp. DSM 111018]|uniref:PTS sugar transporter subunit IIB n=1 Tax=Facklamia lactis TaxID=2749967 RepID=A0ABS0LR12_9LACT|nr:PTS sugar transporter subunit IIB [Facklamia lactis]MBG9985729.1 PTS sugar transporter subunit IIB [Facklamia lactis]